MKKTIIFIFCPFLLNGQNIIPNGSFEDTIKRTTQLFLPDNWKSPTKGSPDYFTPYNTDGRWTPPDNYPGHQEPKTGVAYSGLIIYHLFANNDSKRFREYLQNKFSKALVKDSLYCLQLYISLADSQLFASKNKLGVYFSQNKISSNDFFYLAYTPQIMVSPDTFITEKKEWKKYNFQYQAQGGEEYITIGNFSDSTEIDTLYVGGGDPNNVDFIGTYYYIDDVYLGHCDSVPINTPNGIKENSLLSKLKGYPNPVNEQFTLENNSGKKLNFQLYNTLGTQIEVGVQQSNNKYSFSMRNLPKGIYLLHIVGENERATMKLVKN